MADDIDKYLAQQQKLLKKLRTKILSPVYLVLYYLCPRGHATYAAFDHILCAQPRPLEGEAEIWYSPATAFIPNAEIVPGLKR